MRSTVIDNCYRAPGPITNTTPIVGAAPQLKGIILGCAQYYIGQVILFFLLGLRPSLEKNLNIAAASQLRNIKVACY